MCAILFHSVSQWIKKIIACELIVENLCSNSTLWYRLYVVNMLNFGRLKAHVSLWLFWISMIAFVATDSAKSVTMMGLLLRDRWHFAVEHVVGIELKTSRNNDKLYPQNLLRLKWWASGSLVINWPYKKSPCATFKCLHECQRTSDSLILRKAIDLNPILRHN